MSSGKSYSAEVHRQHVPLRVLATAASIMMVVALVEIQGKAALIACGLAIVAGIAAFLFPRRQRGLVEVRDAALLFDQKAELKRDEIRLVARNPIAQNALVIWRKWPLLRGRTTIIFESAEDAKALVSDLQWDEAQTAAVFYVRRGTHKKFRAKILVHSVLLAVLVYGNLYLACSVPAWQDGALPFLGFTVVAFFLASVRLSARVRVGADGISIRTQLGPKRFISYEAIESLGRQETEITLQLKTGAIVGMSFGTPNRRRASSVRYVGEVSMVDALFQRIENARALFASRAEIRSHLLAALKRDGRSLTEWRLAATSLSHEHYRVAATPREVLETIVQDSAVAPDVRIGAAIALHADAGMRVRVATETSALPELGAAIDAALDGDDSTLEKAIATLKLEG